MKKYLFTALVMASFAIGFIASEEDEISKYQSVEEESVTQLSPKEQEIADAGYKKGSMFGMVGASNEYLSNMLDMADYVDGMDEKVNEMYDNMAGDDYDREYGTPSTEEEKKLKRIYIDNFIKGMNNAMDGMDALDKLGGKHR